MAASEIILQVNMDCAKTASLAAENLQAASFRVVQTFDLQAARSTQSTCSCPHHGTDLCDCQMLILLVYGIDLNPITLLFHGRDQQTQIHWVTQPGQRVNPDMELKVWKAVAGDGLCFA
ncbi:MAG: hypothetical protein EHM41_08570 [Chloroflexi bacterium]|nr:MAG: hypothetical protein EHM41_08570 [Chloroflexota bacterium]